jgi:hypothetical protein
MTHRLNSTGAATARSALMSTALLALGCATAQPGVPKEGSYDVTSCGSGTNSVVEVSKTARYSTNESVGITRSNPPGGFLDMTTYHCMSLGGTLDGKYTGEMYCDVVDKDGDRYLSHFRNEPGKPPTSEVLAGTGKYEGMTRTGTSQSMGQFPSVKQGASAGCARQTGTYKMK